MSDQWKPDGRTSMQKQAKAHGYRITYEALDIPPEPPALKKARIKWIREGYWCNRTE